MSEPQTKFVALVLLFLGRLASIAGSEAVLPAYLVGMVLAPLFSGSRAAEPHANRGFHYPDAVLLPESRVIGRGPRCRGFCGTHPALSRDQDDDQVRRHPTAHARLCLRAARGDVHHPADVTGLTFGSISALFELTNRIIDQQQYTILVTAVIGSAVVPTLIAQRWFLPKHKPMEEIEATSTGRQASHAPIAIQDR